MEHFKPLALTNQVEGLFALTLSVYRWEQRLKKALLIRMISKSLMHDFIRLEVHGESL